MKFSHNERSSYCKFMFAPKYAGASRNWDFYENGRNAMDGLIIKYNELTAEEFITLWETVWGQGPSLEQTQLAMKHTLFRISVWDNDKIVGMSRMIGDMGLNYYIKELSINNSSIWLV